MTGNNKNPKFLYKKWGTTILKGGVAGGVTGGIGTAITGGADLGLIALGSAVAGGVWGAVAYPIEYYENKFWD